MGIISIYKTCPPAVAFYIYFSTPFCVDYLTSVIIHDTDPTLKNIYILRYIEESSSKQLPASSFFGLFYMSDIMMIIIIQRS